MPEAAGADAPKNRPTKAAIFKLAKEIDAKRQVSDDAGMAHAELHKQIDEKLNLDRKAFKDALRLRRMDPSKRDVYLADLDFLRDTFGLDAQESMDFQDAQDGVATGTDAALGKTKLKPADEAHAEADRLGEIAGRAAKDYGSCPYEPGDPRRPYWEHAWKRGQSENAKGIKAPGGNGAEQELDETKLAEVYEAGCEAAREGKPRADNPHDGGTPEHARWDLGFANAAGVTKPNRADGRTTRGVRTGPATRRKGSSGAHAGH